MLNWLIAAVVATVALAVAVRLVEARFAFFPSPGEPVTPADLGVAYDAAFVTTSDGQRLRVWSLPHASPRAVVLYFHGNGGNLSIWAPILAAVQRQGYAVHALDYRGYGVSTGTPSERGLRRDVEAFVRWAVARDSADLPLVYWGRSLGGPMAAYAATVHAADGIIIESSFPDARTLLRGSPLLSVLALFSSYRFATAKSLETVDRPVLVMHGDADSIVPFAAGRALYEQIQGPKQFVSIPGGDHNDPAPPAGAPYWTTIAEFVESLAPGSR